MSGDPWGPLLLQFVLILVNGLFAASEIAVLSMNETKLRKQVDDGDKVAAQLLKLSENPTQFLSTIQVCITLAGFLGAAFAAESFADPLSATIGAAVGIDAARLEGVCVVLVTLVLSFFTLVLGELFPKRLAMHYTEPIARIAMKLLNVFRVIFKPMVWLLSVTTNGLLRLCGVDPKAHEDEVTEDEILQMVDMADESGAIESTEKEMIENIFEFNNLTAVEVMTHRKDVASIQVDEDWDEVIKTIRETGLSRFPVYGEDMDDIVGTLNTRVFLLNMQTEHPKSMREMLREAYFVPEMVQADQLFRTMQMKKIHMAIVIDEYGGMSGIVTMEDLLEEIVGNIYDEFDPQAVAEIVKVTDDTWRVSGQASLEDVADALDVELPLDEDYDTIGGLVFSHFTQIPEDGNHPEVDCNGLHIVVEKLEEHRIETALITVLPRENSDADGNDDQDDQE